MDVEFGLVITLRATGGQHTNGLSSLDTHTEFVTAFWFNREQFSGLLQR